MFRMLWQALADSLRRCVPPLRVRPIGHASIARRAVLAAGLASAIAVPLAQAAEPAVLRVGILQFGTVSWELEVMRSAGLAEREGVRLEIVPLALKDATNVAIQGGAVDVIVNDWIWVARQRAEGRDFTFYPYSQAVGGLMVRPDAGVATLADLRGKRLGVAGGALDKSWLLLRAYALRNLGTDAAALVEPNFAAPPLLNELMLRGELPAVLNFWHYNARLEAAGMQTLLSMEQILAGLGVEGELPLVGWVFRERWANANPDAVSGFLRASAAAKALMLESDAIWADLRPMMKVDDDATFRALKAGFRAGVPYASLADAERAARVVFGILAEQGGTPLVGSAREVPPGTFWMGAGG
ncbi:MAG: ABC transporter substrate-binding protein [Rhodocyclaceae bacterium]